MAEQAGGGTGEQVFSFRRSGAREIRAFDRCGARVSGSQPAHGRRRGSARGRYPPARSWLTELVPLPKVAADVLARKAGRSRTQRGPPVPKSAARRRTENAAAGRREARRPAYPVVISGDPEIGPTARRATGAAFRTSACRRSAPLVF